MGRGDKEVMEGGTCGLELSARRCHQPRARGAWWEGQTLTLAVGDSAGECSVLVDNKAQNNRLLAGLAAGNVGIGLSPPLRAPPPPHCI